MKPYISLLLIALASCSQEDPAPDVNLTGDFAAVPFDNFWLSTQFGNGNEAKYFNTWADKGEYPASTHQTYYNYWETGEIPPNGCNFIYNKDAKTISAVIDCGLARRGQIDPNNPSTFNWPANLTYKITMSANLQTMQITSAVLSFPQYKQTIDLTDVAVVTQRSPNGYEVLSLDFSGKVKTNDYYFLNIKIHIGETL